MNHRTLGYAGHKTAKDTLPPSLKPGDTLESLAGKFSAIANDIISTNSSVSHSNSCFASSKLHFVSVSADTFRNVKQSDYKIPDRRGVSVTFLENSPVSKAFEGRSIFETEIRSAAPDAQWLCSLQSEVDLKPAFDSLTDEEGLVDTRKIKSILATAFNNNQQQQHAAAPSSSLHQPPPAAAIAIPLSSSSSNQGLPCSFSPTTSTATSSSPARWIVDKFTGYYMRFGSRPDGLTDWNEFSKAFHTVSKAARAEAATKPLGFPTWIKEARKLPTRSVTVMEDNSAAAAPKRPFQRPYPYPRSDLLLTYHNNMPGYTGYFPVHSLKSNRPRDFSQCSLTSQGAGFMGLML